MNVFVESFDGQGVIILSALFFAAMMTLIAYFKGFFKLPPYFQLPPRSVTLKDIFFVFFVFMLAQILVAPGIFVLGYAWVFGHWVGIEKAQSDPIAAGWFNVAAMFVSFVCVAAYAFFSRKDTRQAVWSRGEKKWPRDHAKSFAFGMMAWLISYPIVLVLGQLISLLLYYVFGAQEVDQVPVRSLRATLDHPALYALTVVSMVVFVPMAEEILFRGYVQTWLLSIMRRKQAILASAAIFALFHFSLSQELSNIAYVTALFILACFLGFLYERQRSLWAPIGLHSTFNAVSVLIITLT